MRAGAGIVWCALPGARRGPTRLGHRGDHPAVAGRRRGGCARGPRPRRSSPTSAASPRSRSGPGLGGVGDPDVAVRGAHAGRRGPQAARARRRRSERARRRPRAAATPARRSAARWCSRPTPGEYQRLMGAPVGPNRLVAAQALAERAGAVVLLKGPGTVVASPDGAVALNPTGGAALGHRRQRRRAHRHRRRLPRPGARRVPGCRGCGLGARSHRRPAGRGRRARRSSPAISSTGWAVRCRSWE